jgi:hypothetical protein
MPDSIPVIVFDASAYRALAATGVPAAGAVARHLADAERARGVQAGASPFVLWELLATSVPRPGAAPSPGPERDAVARAALVACLAHCARPEGAPPEDARTAETAAAVARAFVLVPDPDSALCLAVTGAVPPDLTAWGEYLASLATEVAAEPTAERVARLAGPLRHVRERARQAAEDFADEVQDAIAAAYEAAAPGWDPSSSSADRQRSLTGASHAAEGGDVEGSGEGGGLLDAVLAHDPLLRAVAVGRARRARRLAAGRGAHAELLDDAVSPELLADAERVVERFPAGVGLLRELLRRVIAGELDLATRAGRRWFWDAQVAFAAGTEGGEVVSGNATVLAAAAADPSGAGRAARPVEEHVRRLGAPARER